MYRFPHLGRFYSEAAVSHIEYGLAVSKEPRIEKVTTRGGSVNFVLIKTAKAVIRRSLVLLNGDSVELNSFDFELNHDSVDWFKSAEFEAKDDKIRSKMVKSHGRLNNMIAERTTVNAKIGGMSHSWDDEEEDNAAMRELKAQRDHFNEEIEKIQNRFTSLNVGEKVDSGFKSIPEATAEGLMTPELEVFYTKLVMEYDSDFETDEVAFPPEEADSDFETDEVAPEDIEDQENADLEETTEEAPGETEDEEGIEHI